MASNEPCYYHERAKSYLLTQQFPVSVTDFNKVIEFQPKNAHAYFGRAFAYKALKQYLESASDFEYAK